MSKKKVIHGDEQTEACSVETFCRRHGISPATYYVLKTKGLAPRETILGGRRLITREAAARWRRQRERKPITEAIHVTA
jgi:hypothetical protein